MSRFQQRRDRNLRNPEFAAGYAEQDAAITAAKRSPYGADGELLEWAWQEQTVGLGRTLDYLVYHIPVSKRATSNGYPDNHYVHTKQPWHLYVELKRHNGKLSDEQMLMLDRLTACAVPCYVWPADKLYGKHTMWEEATAILRHGPRQYGVERTRWPEVLAHYPHLLTKGQWQMRRLLQVPAAVTVATSAAADESPSG